MFTTTKLAIAAAIVLGATFSASAATKPRAAEATRSQAYDVIPGYAKDGSTVAIPNPEKSHS
jgi:hypothetical protein